MSKLLAPCLILTLCCTAPAVADFTYQMTGLEGEYPPQHTQVLTFPQEMAGVSNVVATITHTGQAGVRQCEGEDEPGAYLPGPLLIWEYQGEDGVYTYTAPFPPTYAPGSPVTETVMVNGPPPGLLQGRTVEVRAYFGREADQCEILEWPTATFHSVEITLIGNVVASERTSLSAIKGLFR